MTWLAEQHEDQGDVLKANSFWIEIQNLIDKEIADNQIKFAKIEYMDELRQKAVLKVWRRAAQGDCIEELRSLVNKDEHGKLRCQIICTE